MNIFRAACILLLLMLVSPTVAIAKTETLYATYNYTMGDSDSKSDAKRIAFMEAKRLLLEKIGVYIESETNVRNSQITRDEIKTFSAAILQVEIAEEEQKFVNGNIVLMTTVKTDVDTEKVRRQFESILNDRHARKKIQDQQRQLQLLENKVQELQRAMSSGNYEKTLMLRKERNVIFNEISKLEQIKLSIASNTQAAVENIELGMSPNEVVSLIGNPRSQDKCLSKLYYNYGRVWIVFEGGVVSALVKSEFYHSCGDRNYYRIVDPQGLIK